MSAITALACGALAGVAALLLHTQLVPVGFILAILGSVLTVREVVLRYGRKRYGAITTLGWLLVVWRAAFPGVGGEFLVMGNTAGELLILLGSLVMIATSWIVRPR